MAMQNLVMSEMTDCTCGFSTDAVTSLSCMKVRHCDLDWFRSRIPGSTNDERFRLLVRYLRHSSSSPYRDDIQEYSMSGLVI